MYKYENKLSVLTLNVQGLRNAKTRKTIFRSFKLDNINVVCLQETYLGNDDLDLIQREWGGVVHMSPGSAQTKGRRGLLTLFNKSFTVDSIRLLKQDDRILTSELKIGNDSFVFTNIY